MGWQTFKSHIRFDPGEGSRIHFWDDVWCGDRPLKVAFPGLLPGLRKRLLQVERSNGAIQ
jgi:hypothetical protein